MFGNKSIRKEINPTSSLHIGEAESFIWSLKVLAGCLEIIFLEASNYLKTNVIPIGKYF